MATQVACDLLAIVGRYDALTVRVYGISTNLSAVPTKNCYGALVHKRDEYGVTAEHEAAILADCARGMRPSSLRHLRDSSPVWFAVSMAFACADDEKVSRDGCIWVAIVLACSGVDGGRQRG
jgi:hypothetical protein